MTGRFMRVHRGLPLRPLRGHLPTLWGGKTLATCSLTLWGGKTLATCSLTLWGGKTLATCSLTLWGGKTLATCSLTLWGGKTSRLGSQACSPTWWGSTAAGGEGAAA